MGAHEVLAFWFDELTPKQWWAKEAELDQCIRSRFGALHAAATEGRLVHWQLNALDSLALILVLDQFSRHIFRADAQAFAADDMALRVAELGVSKGFDHCLSARQRPFYYMPYMHSERADVHVQALRLFDALDGENSADFERRHKQIIDQFGRYPHRNEWLGRVSTPVEIEFLQQPGSRF